MRSGATQAREKRCFCFIALLIASFFQGRQASNNYLCN
jgi:hypothetical protein